MGGGGDENSSSLREGLIGPETQSEKTSRKRGNIVRYAAGVSVGREKKNKSKFQSGKARIGGKSISSRLSESTGQGKSVD